jgi:hypothetical protein
MWTPGELATVSGQVLQRCGGLEVGYIGQRCIMFFHSDDTGTGVGNATEVLKCGDTVIRIGACGRSRQGGVGEGESGHETLDSQKRRGHGSLLEL